MYNTNSDNNGAINDPEQQNPRPVWRYWGEDKVEGGQETEKMITGKRNSCGHLVLDYLQCYKTKSWWVNDYFNTEN